MMDFKGVKAAHRAIRLIRKRRTSAEIISSLQSKYDLVNVPLMDIETEKMSFIKSSAETAVTNDGYNLSSEKMTFRAYRIPKTERNSCLEIPSDDPDGLFIIEMNTSYFFCDLQRIFIEATYLLGFDDRDRVRNSDLYRHVTSIILMHVDTDQD